MKAVRREKLTEQLDPRDSIPYSPLMIDTISDDDEQDPIADSCYRTEAIELMKLQRTRNEIRLT